MKGNELITCFVTCYHKRGSTNSTFLTHNRLPALFFFRTQGIIVASPHKGIPSSYFSSHSQPPLPLSSPRPTPISNHHSPSHPPVPLPFPTTTPPLIPPSHSHFQPPLPLSSPRPTPISNHHSPSHPPVPLPFPTTTPLSPPRFAFGVIPGSLKVNENPQRRGDKIRLFPNVTGKRTKSALGVGRSKCPNHSSQRLWTHCSTQRQSKTDNNKNDKIIADKTDVHAEVASIVARVPA